MLNGDLTQDLHDILSNTTRVWEKLRNQRLFITGGTGFIGKWLLYTFAEANQQFDLNLQVGVLTRNRAALNHTCPLISRNPNFHFVEGDVRTFQFPAGTYSYLIHGAAAASAELNRQHPELMLDTIIRGTQHTLDFAAQAGVEHGLFLSSGAIYGKATGSVEAFSETYRGSPDVLDPASAYAVGKFTAEHLCALFNNTKHQQRTSPQQPLIRPSGTFSPCVERREQEKKFFMNNTAQWIKPAAIKIARLFAFVGPGLPLDAHFAIGNFIRDGLNGDDIQINSSGTAIRSYQYITDLIIWLMHILCFGETNHPYNVGSGDRITIRDLANVVAAQFHHHPKIHIQQSEKPAMIDCYAPDISRARKELGLSNRIDLVDAIRKTIAWHLKSKVVL